MGRKKGSNSLRHSHVKSPPELAHFRPSCLRASGLLLRGGREGGTSSVGVFPSGRFGLRFGASPRVLAGKRARRLLPAVFGVRRRAVRTASSSGGGQAFLRPGWPYIRRPASFAGITDRRKSVLMKSVMEKSILVITLSSVIMRASFP